ncbi:Cytochrome P450 4V2, partial [Chytridiales sp. JEL 0842]
AFKRSDTLQAQAVGIFKYALFSMPTGDMWKKHRKYMQPGFGPAQLRHAFETTNDALDILFDIWNTHLSSAKESFRTDISHVASCITLDVIGQTAFSYDYGSVLHHENHQKLQDMKAYKRSFRVFLKRFAVPKAFWNVLGIGEEYAKKETAFVRQTILNTITSKRSTMKEQDEADMQNPSTIPGMKQLDVLDRLLQTDGTWTDEEIVDEVMALFFAGHDTTAATITTIVYLLVKNPQVLARLHDELDTVLGSPASTQKLEWDNLSKLRYTEQVIKEALRLHPIAIGSLFRVAVSAEGAEIAGYKIPQGTEVDIDIRGLHRSSKFWDDPLTFDPSRWIGNFTPVPGSYMPFLNGVHMCLGMKLAMIELKIVIARLFHAYQFGNDVTDRAGEEP